MSWIVGLLALLLLGAYLISRPPAASAGDLRLHRLAPDVYLYRGFFSNSAVLVLPRSILVVDTQVSPLGGRRLAQAIRAVSDLPVRHVINTHYHGDHTGGNAAFPGAEIIATADTARFVVERDAERVEYAETFGLAFREVHPTLPPTRTFSGRLELEVDGERLLLLQLGRVETPDACVLWWPARRVAVVGDGVATHDYPFLGVPFMDEGLRDDGSWLGFLRALLDYRPLVLLPGHGPALVGELRVRARLLLLEELFTRLLAEVRPRLAAERPVGEIVREVDQALAAYPRRRDLREKVVSQRFAIYRAINNLSPQRAGRGWWADLRPSVVRHAPAEEVAALLAAAGGDGARARALARAEARAGREDRARDLLAAWTADQPQDGAAWGLLADLHFAAAARIRPAVDATEHIRHAARAAHEGGKSAPDDPLVLLAQGSVEVFGGMILAQPMDQAIPKLERALASGALSWRQRVRGAFFLGRAHQIEGRDAESDRAYRAMFPPLLRPLFPLLRARLRVYP